MTQARKTQICVDHTPFYHCVGRCVRRAFLCGQDHHSGRSYEHRRGWMQERIALLSRVFAIEICAYALMSNHYHLVLKVCPEVPTQWSDEDVIERWTALFSGPVLIHRYRRGAELKAGDMRLAREIVDEWRRRLSDISWFMRCLNEYIARRSNREDGVTGHFWEARFKSQALLDDVALLTGMVYVDLNPIRAGMASSVADSAYTSAQQRYREIMLGTESPTDPAVPRLAIFNDQAEIGSSGSLPFSLRDYLQLVDQTGRCCRDDKRGFIEDSVPGLLTERAIGTSAWLDRMRETGGLSGRALGAPDQLRRFAKRLRQSWLKGITTAALLYPT